MKLINKLCQFFFAKADILSEKNPYFGKHLFAKQELITRDVVYKTLGLVRIPVLISTITKTFLVFLNKVIL